MKTRHSLDFYVGLILCILVVTLLWSLMWVFYG